MLHIRPITEEQANAHIAIIYNDIKQSFHVSIVPLLFQYLANFEDYFAYVWEKIKANVESEYFKESTQAIGGFTKSEIDEIYVPSRGTVTFTTRLHKIEKDELMDTVKKLDQINARLLVLTIGMREGLKGVQVREKILAPHAIDISREFFEIFANEVVESTKKEATASSRMLAPLFGASALAFSHYSEFFSHIASDMDELVATEDYLTKRVMLEHEVLKRVGGLMPLGCSYTEVAKYAMDKPHFGELLYILTETFPSQFPRMLVTSFVMQKALTYNPSAITQL